MFSGIIVSARPRRRATRSFTLVELLVVMAVIIILASLALPALIRAFGAGETTKCLTQIRQVGFGYLNYLKDYDYWMPCAGNQGDEMLKSAAGGGKEAYEPTYELPWFRPAWTQARGFLYWYEAFQPYINSAANRPAAITSYKARVAALTPAGKLYEDNPIDEQYSLVRAEMARLMGVLRCPGKRDAAPTINSDGFSVLRDSPVGYGYNYTAPFGNTACYPNNRDDFKWYQKDMVTFSTTPINYAGLKVPVPILWYGQYVHSSTLTSPSTQVGFCDTGKVRPDISAEDARGWYEESQNCGWGYVRFPLMASYWDGVTVGQYNNKDYSWRPIGRHAGKVSSLFFDGAARVVPIRDLCSPGIQWGDPPCLFDNRPPNRPPISPLRSLDVDGKPPTGS